LSIDPLTMCPLSSSRLTIAARGTSTRWRNGLGDRARASRPIAI
jgi:hypothetical protein